MLPVLLNNNPYSTSIHKLKLFSYLVFSCIFITGGIAGYAQQVQINSYKNYDTKNGLVSLNVRKIVRDKYGFIWCATQDGLSRFDGRQFINFSSNTTDDKYLLIGADVFDILLEDDGEHLWALTAYGGLNRISITKNKVIEKFSLQPFKNQNSDLWYKCMRLYNGYIYIGTDEGLLLKFSLSRKQVIGSYNLQQLFSLNSPIDELLVKGADLWLFSSGKGIAVIDTGLITKKALLDSLTIGGASNKSFFFFDLAESGDRILIATDIGLKAVNTVNYKIIQPEIPDALKSSVIRCLTTWQDSIYISGDAGLFIIDASSHKYKEVKFSKNIENKPWFNLSNTLMVSTGVIWLGTQYGILSSNLTPHPFTAFSNSLDKSSAIIQHCMSLLSLDDSVLFACADDGLYIVNHTTGVIQKKITDDVVYSILKKSTDLYIASSKKTLTLLNHKGEIKNIDLLYPELKSLKSTPFISSASYKDSLYFFASLYGYGIYIWNPKNRVIKQLNTNTTPSLKSNVINRLFVDSRNRLWIICDKYFSVYNLQENTVSSFSFFLPGTKTRIGINMDICESKDKYWVAVYGTGILEVDSNNNLKKIWGTESGINNLGLYKIFVQSDSTLITSSNNGLSILNFNTGKVSNYFETDGLNTNNFEETSGDIYGKSVFLGGLNGFTKIEASKFRHNLISSPPLFTSVTFDMGGYVRDSCALELSKITIPTSSLQTTIHFTALNYQNPERTSFAYRIVELHKEWINLGSQSFITPTGLKPGTYHLYVQAFNEDVVPSEIKTLTLIFLPKWYQTLFFKILVGLAIFALAWAFYRLRINQLKKEQRIRTKLASDLHDDLGSTLNSVKLYANLATMENPNGKYTPLIIHSTQEAITGIRDMIWVLDDSKDSVEDLLARISNFATPLCEANQVHYVQDFSDEARHHKLGQEERRNLYMMLKETINNAIKYAGGSTITVTASVRKGKPAFSISDNGKGFDTSLASEGNGLKNLQRRSAEIKYRLHLDSAPGTGTTIRIEKE